jgi:hypothetical protein
MELTLKASSRRHRITCVLPTTFLQAAQAAKLHMLFIAASVLRYHHLLCPSNLPNCLTPTTAATAFAVQQLQALHLQAFVPGQVVDLGWRF